MASTTVTRVALHRLLRRLHREQKILRKLLPSLQRGHGACGALDILSTGDECLAPLEAAASLVVAQLLFAIGTLMDEQLPLRSLRDLDAPSLISLALSVGTMRRNLTVS